MQASEKKLSARQRGAIFAIAGKAELDNDALHDVVMKVTGSESIARLTSRQANRVIEHLNRLTESQAPLGWLTSGQRGKIFALCRELKWTKTDGALDMARLEGFVRVRFKVDKLQWVQADKGGQIIEALKKMVEGGRGERKRQP